MRKCRCLHCIMPPHILKRLLEAKDKDVRQAALNTLLATARMRGMRQVRAGLTGLATGTGTGQRTIFDLRHSEDESGGTVVRTETGPASADASVNRAFDGLGTTRDFYKTVLDRNSIDDHGMNLLGKVHYARRWYSATAMV